MEVFEVPHPARALDLKEHSQGSLSALLVWDIFLVESIHCKLFSYFAPSHNDETKHISNIYFLHLKKIKHVEAPSDAQTAQLKIKIRLKSSFIHSNPHLSKYFATRSLGAFWTTTSIWRPFGPAFLPFGHSLGKYQSQVVWNTIRSFREIQNSTNQIFFYLKSP